MLETDTIKLARSSSEWVASATTSQRLLQFHDSPHSTSPQTCYMQRALESAIQLDPMLESSLTYA